ncbi:MAG: hypothetical protein ABF633_01630 [Clostridium sp.]|uniref:hypothetical protein n=1 Tax=Clostridium sp. TaxID=1506 RepID=UPI0039E8B51F
MNQLFRRLVYKLFKRIICEELQKEMHNKFQLEQIKVAEEYAAVDWDEVTREYDRANREEDYTEELKAHGIMP